MTRVGPAPADRAEGFRGLTRAVAHDVNNLVFVVRAQMALAAEALGAEHPVVGELERLEPALERASRLAAHLQAVGRRPAGPPANPNAVIRELADDPERAVGVQVTLELEEELPCVTLDAHGLALALTQVLTIGLPGAE